MSLDLEFIEKETNIGADFVLVAKLALPCGHDVEHSAIFRVYQESQFDIKQVREMAQNDWSTGLRFKSLGMTAKK